MIWRTLTSFVTHRELVVAMALRELTASTQGAVLGAAWVLLRPLVQTVAYVAIVTLLVGRARTGASLDYAAWVLAGMLPWAILSRTLEEAPSLLRARMELVKPVIYPIETLPLSTLLSTAVGAGVSLLVLLILTLWRGQLCWSWLALPIPLLLLAALVVGASWVLMVAGVLLKDLREVAAVALGLLVYATPVVARPELIGPEAWRLIQWNPLTHVVLCFHDVLRGELHPWSWVIHGALATAMLLVGAAVMARAKVHINEYI